MLTGFSVPERLVFETLRESVSEATLGVSVLPVTAGTSLPSAQDPVFFGSLPLVTGLEELDLVSLGVLLRLNGSPELFGLSFFLTDPLVASLPTEPSDASRPVSGLLVSITKPWLGGELTSNPRDIQGELNKSSMSGASRLPLSGVPEKVDLRLLRLAGTFGLLLSLGGSRRRLNLIDLSSDG